MRQSELHGDVQSGYAIPPLSDEAQQMNGPKVSGIRCLREIRLFAGTSGASTGARDLIR